MAIHVMCPGCQARLKLPETVAGQTLNCPRCKRALKIPGKAASFDVPGPLAPPKPPPLPPVKPPPVPVPNLSLDSEEFEVVGDENEEIELFERDFIPREQEEQLEVESLEEIQPAPIRKHP